MTRRGHHSTPNKNTTAGEDIEREEEIMTTQSLGEVKGVYRGHARVGVRRWGASSTTHVSAGRQPGGRHKWGKGCEISEGRRVNNRLFDNFVDVQLHTT